MITLNLLIFDLQNLMMKVTFDYNKYYFKETEVEVSVKFFTITD